MADIVSIKRVAREEAEAANLTGNEMLEYIKQQVAEFREAEKLKIESENEKLKIESEKELQIRLAQIEAEKVIQLRQAELAAPGMCTPNSPSSQTSTEHSNDSFTPQYYSFTPDIFDPSLETIDVYLNRYEHLAVNHNVHKELWVRHLVQSLRGQAYEVYNKLPSNDKGSYETLKNALLIKYELTARSYNRKFRESQIKEGETYVQFADRLNSYLIKWVELASHEKTFQGLAELVLTEQLRHNMSYKMKVFLDERKVGTFNKLVELADRYATAHQEENLTTHPPRPRLDKPQVGRPNGPIDKKNSHRYPPQHENQQTLRPYHQTNGGSNRLEHSNPFPSDRRDRPTQARVSSVVVRTDSEEPENPMTPIYNLGTLATCTNELETQVTLIDESKTSPTPGSHNGPKETDTVELNGEPATCHFDSGCQYDSIVSASRIRPGDLTGQFVSLRGPSLSAPVQNLPIARIHINSPFVRGTINAAVMKDLVYDVILGCKYVFLAIPQTPMILTPVITQARPETVDSTVEPPPSHQDFIKAQQEDLSLNSVREKNQTSLRDSRTAYVFFKANLLYRQPCADQDEKPQVIDIAHDFHIGAHQEQTSTVQKVKHDYYWPGMSGDSKRFVSSGHQGQVMTKKRLTPPVPLGEIPVGDIPIKRVSVDLIGPLPRSRYKDAYILSVVCQSTKWPDRLPTLLIHGFRQNLNRRLMRQSLSLTPYIPGPENCLSDFLNRHSIANKTGED